MYGWKMRDQGGMESQTSHCVTYIPHCHVYVAVFLGDYTGGVNL